MLVEQPAQAIDVFRFVHVSTRTDRSLSEDFRSDRARGKPVRGRAKRIPELHDGLSAFRTLDLARARWRELAAHLERRGRGRPTIGDWVACVRLSPGCDFGVEDLGDPDGHLTVWGDELKLAEAVTEIVPVEVR